MPLSFSAPDRRYAVSGKCLLVRYSSPSFYTGDKKGAFYLFDLFDFLHRITVLLPLAIFLSLDLPSLLILAFNLPQKHARMEHPVKVHSHTRRNMKKCHS